jgi:hypothetical protein
MNHMTWILLLLLPDVMDLEHNLCDIIKKIFILPPLILSGGTQSTWTEESCLV